MSDRDLIRELYETVIADESQPLLEDDGADVQLGDNDVFDGFGPDRGDSAFQTDTEHQFEEVGASRIGPNGEVLGELDAEFYRRERKRAEDNELVPFRNINPSSADRGTLGNQITALPNQDTARAGELVQVVNWPGDDREVCPVTVTLSPLELPEVTGFSTVGTIRPVARIQWGTRNAQFEVDVDIGTGITFTFNASSVYVSVYLDEGSDTPCVLQGSLGFWAATPHNPPIRTAYLDNIGSGATEQKPRPKFGNRIVAFDRSDPNIKWVLTFRNLNSDNIGCVVISANQYLQSPIILGNDVVAIDCQNQGPAGQNARLIFGVM